jgi:hypothetical protein
MKIYTNKDVFEVTSAEQYLDGVHLLNEDGSIFIIITQPERIKKVEGGEIVVVERPEPSEVEDISALIVDHEYRLTLLELFTDMTV